MPIGESIFALLGFFLASACGRAFKIKSVASGILIVSAVVLMLGNVPIGSMIYGKFPAIGMWLIDNPSMAAQRGLIVSMGLGSLALAVRTMLGLERGY